MNVLDILKPCERCFGASMNDCQTCRVINSIPTKEDCNNGKMLLPDRKEDTAN